jgi:perosamine synthetase
MRFSTFGPHISSFDSKYVLEAMKQKNWYIKPYYFVEKFEKKFADYHNRKYALMTSNCTSAIHLFLESLNLKKDDEVIAPECTWIASVAPVLQTKAKLILCDVENDNWCLSLKTIQKKISAKTKVIISVNIFGNMPNYNEIVKFCKKKKIYLLEDSAESLGSTYFGKKSGSFGDASVFSFHRTKTITTGEGGMLLLNNKSLFEKCRMLRDHGRGPKTKDLFNDIFAFKYMPFNLQAALGYSQFLRIKFLLKKKREIFEIYKSKLKNNKNIQLNLDNKFIKNGCWAVAMTVKNAKQNTIKLINQALIKKKYMPRPFFYPISMLPAYRRKYKNYIYYKKNNLNAYNLAKKSLVLPSSYLLNKNDIINITKIIKTICLKNNL